MEVIFSSMSAYEQHKADCAKYQQEWSAIVDALRQAGLTTSKDGFGSFCPYQQFVRLDALKKEDWPHGINDNSIYVDFRIDMQQQTLETRSWGHIWLTAHDQKASYLAMCGMKKAVEAVGGKWMRKGKYKDATDLAKKVKKFWEQAMDCVSRASGGYPYKQMIVNIY